MKTKTFLFLGIITVLVVFGTNTASAQKGVIKFQYCNTCEIGQSGCENTCVPGEWLVGEGCFENLLSNHNWVTKCIGGVLMGYIKDANGNFVPSGNVYTQHGIVTGEMGKNEIFSTMLFKDGKLVSTIRWRFHITTNANGEVTAFMDKLDVDCK